MTALMSKQQEEGTCRGGKQHGGYTQIEKRRRHGREFLTSILDDHSASYVTVKEQRLGLDWFQSPFKHFSPPGIQLKDAIIFFYTAHATFPLFSPNNSPSISYFIDVAGRQMRGYPVAPQPT